MRKIFIRRDHVGFESVFLRAPDQCPDNVVGFITIAGQNRDSESIQHAADVRQGLDEILGHGLARGLIIGEIGMPLRGSVGIESDGDVGGLLVFKDFEHGLREPVEGGGIHSF